MLNKRQQGILKMLTKSDRIIADVLARKLEVSTKTIYNDIQKINDLLKLHGVSIKTIAGVGVFLEQEDDANSIETIIDELTNENNYGVYESYEQRAFSIISELILSDNFMTISDLAESFFVDRTTISKDIKFITEGLIDFKLEKVQKPYYGLKIVGEEINKRLALVQFSAENRLFTPIMNEKIFAIIKHKIDDVLMSDGISMSKENRRLFMKHIIVMINRIENNNYIEFNENRRHSLDNNYERTVANDISEAIHRVSNFRIQGDELTFITMLLLIYKTNTISEIESCVNNDLIPSIKTEIIRILSHIKEVFEVDFTQDIYLIRALGLYYNQMLMRLKYNIPVFSELHQEIKNKYTFSYLIAYEFLRFVSEESSYHVNDNEATLIAVHIEYAFERSTVYQQRALLVNDYSSSIVEFIQYQLMTKIDKKIELIETISSSQLRDYALDNIQVIITTGEIDFDCSKEIIVIDPILLGRDIDELNQKLKPSNKVDDIEIKRLDVVALDEYYHKLLAENGQVENNYHLVPTILYRNVLVKVVITSGYASIKIIKIKRPFFYDAKYVTEMVIVYAMKGKIRRTFRILRDLYK